MKPSDALLDFGNPVAYYPGLVKYLGSVHATLFFCQILYHTGKEQHPELGVYKTAEEIEAETGLSRDEQRTARKHLRDRGVLFETERRIEHRIYYKLDLEVFDSLSSVPTPKSEYPNGGWDIPTSRTRDIPTVPTEKTTERTTESLQKAAPSANRNEKGRLTKKPPDERFTPFREDFEKYFRHKVGADPGWDGKEAANLSRWLAANPTITCDQWKNILRHRARSPVNHAQLLSAWIGKALTWLHQPMDEWGKEPRDGHVPHSKTAQNLGVLEQFLRKGQHRDLARQDGFLAPGSDRCRGA